MSRRSSLARELWPAVRSTLAGLVLAQMCAGGVHAQANNNLTAPAQPPDTTQPDLPRQFPDRLDEAAFPIPPGPERPFGVEDGDRIFVEQFRLQGAKERPAQDLRIEELKKLVEQIRIRGQGLDEVGEDGFTDDERKAVLGFFRRVVDLQEFDDYLFDDYTELVGQMRDERLERRAGLTIGQLQEVADAVTRYYKDKGFVLAQAFIPAQEVEEGKVTIEVIEGTLGQVIAQGNEGYSQELLAAPFEDLVDAPVTNAAIESAVLTLRDYPGLVPTALFRPGAEVGTSDLVLSVQREKPYEVALTFDNNGTRATGERRFLIDAQWNNPSGAGDALRGQVLQSFKPKNATFFSVEYVRPIWPGTRVGAKLSKQSFDVGRGSAVATAAAVQAQVLSGIQTEAELGVFHDLFRSRFSNVRGELTLRRSNSVTKRQKTVTNKQNLAYVDASITFDSIDTKHDGVNVGSLGLQYGLNGHLGGDSSTQVESIARGITQSATLQPPVRSGFGTRRSSNDFTLLKGQFSRLQALRSDLDLLMRLEGQWSNSLLAPELQYSMGGPNNVRAYSVSELSMDTAFFGSMEFFWKAPGFADADAFSNLKWGDILKLSFFADYSVGTLNQAQVGDVSHDKLAGMGLGAQFEVPGEFIARLQAAYPVLSTRQAQNARATQWWFDVNYRF